MQSVWGVDHGPDEVAKGFMDYVQARKATHEKRNQARGKGFREAADLDGLKRTFTSRSYRKAQTAELRSEYNKAKTSRKKKS